MSEAPTRYFHGSLSTLKPGDVIHSTDELKRRGMLGKQFSGLTMQYGHLNEVHDMALEDGSRVRRTGVTYHSTSQDEAEDWGSRPLMKSSPDDFNRLGAAGHRVSIYEVEPHNPRRPSGDDLHSQHEVVADHAVVKSVVAQHHLDRFCSNPECGDYIGSWGGDHVPHCPSCGARQPSG